MQAVWKKLIFISYEGFNIFLSFKRHCLLIEPLDTGCHRHLS